jgi:hypothetical protein
MILMNDPLLNHLGCKRIANLTALQQGYSFEHLKNGLRSQRL